MEKKETIEQIFAEAIIQLYKKLDDELILLNLLKLKWYQLN